MIVQVLDFYLELCCSKAINPFSLVHSGFYLFAAKLMLTEPVLRACSIAGRLWKRSNGFSIKSFKGLQFLHLNARLYSDAVLLEKITMVTAQLLIFRH